MAYIKRLIQTRVEDILSRGKSIMLLGPRQTGKTTLLTHEVKADLEYTFLNSETRRRYETDPDTLLNEIDAYTKIKKLTRQPIILIDEIQKVPAIMDAIQNAIDNKLARFVLTGSSARKLKRNQEQQDINLLPGRVIQLHMDSLSLLEIPPPLPDIEDLLLNGSLPEVIQQNSAQHKEQLLQSYVNIYLEEEIRMEAVVRNLASFSRFLTYAAVEAGNEINVNNLSQEIGVSRHTINEYYQILIDCLIADRIEPITDLTTRRRLTKSPKYLFFDLGIRRIAAGEGLRLPQKYYGQLFEQFVGIELLKIIRLQAPQANLKYWHDHAGPEVDYVIEYNRQYIPIEVKWTSNPTKQNTRHLVKFMQEYNCATPAYVICRTPRAVTLGDDIIAINWRELAHIIAKLLK